MATPLLESFGRTATALARNPLGVIALFIVLVYGLAALTTAAATTLTAEERTLLVYFLALFPVGVLLVFVYLVTCHIGKLYGPGDFQDEENFLIAAALLGAAAAKKQSPGTGDDMGKIVGSARVVASARRPRAMRVLWVDDRPANNEYERQALEAIGVDFTLAESTMEALEILRWNEYAAIISDMGRREGPREGYVLLDKLREQGDRTPLFFYAASNEPEHKRETYEHGGQGCTNSPQELFDMVTRAVISREDTRRLHGGGRRGRSAQRG